MATPRDSFTSHDSWRTRAHHRIVPHAIAARATSRRPRMSRAFDLTAPPPPRPRRARADADADAAAVTLELDARWAAMFAATARRRAARRAGADDGRARAVSGRARTREWIEREVAVGRGRTDARGRTEAYGAAGVV